MGFYFRKSVSFGGLRLNFSKSGVGASVGTKGFRFGISPRGNYVRIGANGLYYRTMIGKKEIRVIQYLVKKIYRRSNNPMSLCMKLKATMRWRFLTQVRKTC